MKFLKHFLSLFLLSLSTLSFASHIVGGDIYYDNLGNGDYRITLIIYRDCNSTGAAFDDPVTIGVFSGGNLFREVTIPRPPIEPPLAVVLNNPCVTPPTNICTERAIYTTIVNLPPNAGGYTLAYQRCCRGPNITNLTSPEDTGLTLTTNILGTNSGAWNNSSPRFASYPPLVICNNVTLEFDHSATDPDSDSLVYSISSPYQGASDVEPMPVPPPGPPYFPVSFGTSFTPITPLGAGATVTIDQTGHLTVSPENLGLFVVGIKVQEFRNGVLINEIIRDFLFRVVDCVVQLGADLVPQAELQTFVSYCQGNTITFENQSFGGTNYLWDFGIDTMTTDISTQFEPTYTFPGPGSYNVTLVVNPGWPCTDTAQSIFIIMDSLDIDFEVNDSVCITGNSLDFIGDYFGPPNPVFTWSFGPNANPTSSSDLSTFNVAYSQPGFHNVTLTVVAQSCTGIITKPILIYNEPTIDFTTNTELKCLPYLAQFNDLSVAYSPLEYLWDFGDGTSSTQRNPAHLYEQGGIYDVSLQITSTAGCITTLNLTKDDLVQVFPRPSAGFSLSRTSASVFEPFFSVYDESFNRTLISYEIDDSIYYFQPNLELAFNVSGNHSIYQYVENEFGCRDSVVRYIRVEPETTIYIPNVFTPDGNQLNNTFLPIVRDVIEYEFYIYNRWGELIFQTFDETIGWDGTYKGKLAPNGIYTYIIKYKEYGAVSLKSKEGFVTLLK